MLQAEFVRGRHAMFRTQTMFRAALFLIVATTWFIAVLWVAATAGAVDTKAADKPTDELVGVWRLISANGEKHPEADSPDRSTLLTYDGDAKTWKLTPRSDADGQEFFGSYFADATQTPKLLDATIKGDGGDTPVYAIYKIEEGVLTIHFRNDGQRPGDFDTPADQGSLLVLKRHEEGK
jgi:uncharacterized protein (TIGR03067 family)